MLGILVMVAIVNPFMLLTTAVCGVAMYLWTMLYLSTAQAIKRYGLPTAYPYPYMTPHTCLQRE